jgi:hypothetical protein
MGGEAVDRSVVSFFSYRSRYSGVERRAVPGGSSSTPLKAAREGSAAQREVLYAAFCGRRVSRRMKKAS